MVHVKSESGNIEDNILKTIIHKDLHKKRDCKKWLNLDTVDQTKYTIRLHLQKRRKKTTNDQSVK